MKTLKLSLFALFVLFMATDLTFASNSSNDTIYKQIKIKSHLENRLTAIRTEKRISALKLANLTAQKNMLESQKETDINTKASDEIDFQLAQIACDQDVLKFINKKHQDIFKMYKRKVRICNDNIVAAQIKTPEVIIPQSSSNPIDMLKAERNKLRYQLVTLAAQRSDKENQRIITNQTITVVHQIKEITDVLAAEKVLQSKKKSALSNRTNTIYSSPN